MIRPAFLTLIALGFTLWWPPSQACGQCSDAGVCIVGKPRSSGHSLGLSYNFSLGILYFL